MEKRRKIILIGPVYPYKGGIAHYTSLLYRALSKENQVDLVSYKMQYPRFLFKKEQKDYSDDMFKVDGVEFLLNTANPFNIINVAMNVKKRKPDAVIMQWWHPYFAPCYFIFRMILGRKCKVIFTCHNVFPHERFWGDRFLVRLALKLGDGYIVHSKCDKEDLINNIKKNAKVVFSPLPTYGVFKIRNMTKKMAVDELNKDDGVLLCETSPVILFFGLVREYKGLKHLLRAMPQVVRCIPEIKLIIAGSFGNDKDDYEDLIDNLHIKDNIYIEDNYIPDCEVEKYFSVCDLVVLPYESATQSGVVQTAFGFEKPVLVTNVGGLPDVVENMKTGYIVESNSSKEIAKAIIDFFDNCRMSDMQAAIAADAERFSWDHMAKEVQDLIC